MRQLPQHIYMTWVKTLCNAWATTSRLHIDPVASCIFCHAPSQNVLLHYLSCNKFRQHLQVEIPSPPLTRRLAALGISPCDFVTIKYMFVRFTVYHAIHNDFSKHMSSGPERWHAIVQNTVRAASNKFEDLVSARRAR